MLRLVVITLLLALGLVYVLRFLARLLPARPRESNPEPLSSEERLKHAKPARVVRVRNAGDAA